MTEKKRTTIGTPDPWHTLKSHTAARIALGRCGTSPPLTEILNFRKAHAAARDAVNTPLDKEYLKSELSPLPVLTVQSNAQNRNEYLSRPDKGRTLSDASHNHLNQITEANPVDLCLIAADGLSSRAIHENASPFLHGFIPLAQKAGLTISPVILVQNGRVAIGDEIGHLLQARLVIICIGERPGLLSPNSMGIYITYTPKPGTTDAFRNCISNVRPEGMPVPDAINKTAYLVEEALRLSKTGVELKDRMGDGYLAFGHGSLK